MWKCCLLSQRGKRSIDYLAHGNPCNALPPAVRRWYVYTGNTTINTVICIHFCFWVVDVEASHCRMANRMTTSNHWTTSDVRPPPRAFEQDEGSYIPKLVPMEHEQSYMPVLDYYRNTARPDLVLVPATQISPSGVCTPNPDPEPPCSQSASGQQLAAAWCFVVRYLKEMTPVSERREPTCTVYNTVIHSIGRSEKKNGLGTHEPHCSKTSWSLLVAVLQQSLWRRSSTAAILYYY